jgi:hypothetical protein
MTGVPLGRLSNEFKRVSFFLMYGIMDKLVMLGMKWLQDVYLGVICQNHIQKFQVIYDMLHK